MVDSLEVEGQSGVTETQPTEFDQSQVADIIAQIDDEALRKDVAELLTRSINARQRLSIIDLKPYEGAHLELDGLEIWKELAPQFSQAMAAVSKTLEFLTVLAPEPHDDAPIDDARLDAAFGDFDEAFSEEAFGAPAEQPQPESGPVTQDEASIPPGDLRVRLAQTAWAISYMLKDELLRFGSRMRQVNVMMERWSLLAQLQETCHKLTKGLDALMLGVCSAFSPVSRDQVIPGFGSELAFSLELRRLIFELRDKIQASRAKMDTLPQGEWGKIGKEIFELLDNFVYGPTFGWLRAFDKREVIQFRHNLRELLDDDSAVGRDFHQPIEGIVRFMEALEVINHREILVEHDRNVLQEAASHLEKALSLPKIEGRQEFAAAISCLSKAWGRDPQLDAMVESTLDPMADIKTEDILTRVQLTLGNL